MLRHITSRGTSHTTSPAILLFALAIFTVPAEAQNKACALATPDELKSLLGAAVSGLKNDSGLGDVAICQGQTPSVTVMLRLAKRSGGATPSDAAAKGIEKAKQAGFQVEVKTFGPITCSTLIPPAKLAQYGYNTTCSVSKNGQVAAIEIGAKQQKDMVSIDKLHPLAEKIAQRF